MIGLHKVATAVLACGGAVLATPASAQCVVPNTLSNGQVADATDVMENFEAVADCADAVGDVAVTTTGAPASGELAVFSGTQSVTGGDLTGDVTTSGSTVATLSPTGVTAGTYSYATVTVDAKGRVASATNGAGGGGAGQTIVRPYLPNWTRETNSGGGASSLVANSDATAVEFSWTTSGGGAQAKFWGVPITTGVAVDVVARMSVPTHLGDIWTIAGLGFQEDADANRGIAVAEANFF